MFDLFLAAFVCTWGIMCAAASAIALAALYMEAEHRVRRYLYRVAGAFEQIRRAKSGNVNASITFCGLPILVRYGARFAYWWQFDRSPEGQQ